MIEWISEGLKIRLALPDSDNPSKKEIDKFIKDRVSFFDRKISVELKRNQEKTQAALNYIQRRHFLNGVYRSKPGVILDYLNDQVIQVMFQQAAAAGSSKNLPLFALYFDFAHGALTNLGVLGSTLYSTQERDSLFAQSSSATGKALGLGVGDQADLFLGSTKSLQEFKKLLEEDPSGFKCLDLVTANIEKAAKGREGILQRLIPEVFVSGAKFGVRRYKEIYPIA